MSESGAKGSARLQTIFDENFANVADRVAYNARYPDHGQLLEAHETLIDCAECVGSTPEELNTMKDPTKQHPMVQAGKSAKSKRRFLEFHVEEGTKLQYDFWRNNGKRRRRDRHEVLISEMRLQIDRPTTVTRSDWALVFTEVLSELCDKGHYVICTMNKRNKEYTPFHKEDGAIRRSHIEHRQKMSKLCDFFPEWIEAYKKWVSSSI